VKVVTKNQDGMHHPSSEDFVEERCPSQRRKVLQSWTDGRLPEGVAQ